MRFRHLHEHVHAFDPEARKLIHRLICAVDRLASTASQPHPLILQGLQKMADLLDTVIDKISTQTTVIAGLDTLVDTFIADRAALRQQIVDLQTALGEAGNDTEQVASIIAGIDASDAKLAGIRDKLAPAVIENTPADEG